VSLHGTLRYLAGGYRTRELARVFRCSQRQLGHSVAYEHECAVLSASQFALYALVKRKSSVSKHC
jgi:D-Tyr-tRNAtyr deacylase